MYVYLLLVELFYCGIDLIRFPFSRSSAVGGGLYSKNFAMKYQTNISTVMSKAAAAVCTATRAGSAEPRRTAASMASLASEAVSSAATSSAGAANQRAPRRHQDCFDRKVIK